ncbi:hypothetical protein H0A36_26570 [Endozoicomonas sp. SM1973]|uniref:Uncharacterized protein n=1 Tax=Spartinivicinus marinus TaxID=2994442 RepID=A0A853I8D9_9GAMM|nr:hypothetical protein [Spartinivicinus marinus]MCX4026428.1 hypothetical protein [Spartinivicinus marinus]NYZ69583.1 hypothetical protein [Spartinivicinus marinus]
MKNILATFLLLLSTQVFAGGGSIEVELLSMTETEDAEYTLKYRSIESGETYTVYLSYDKWGYLFDSWYSQDKYASAINLLKKQLKQKAPARFGWFRRCVVDESKNIYRSDALDIFEERNADKRIPVVYAFCEQG